MVAGTFNAFTTVDGQVQLSEAARPNGAAGTISLLFYLIRYGIWAYCRRNSTFPAGKQPL